MTPSGNTPDHGRFSARQHNTKIPITQTFVAAADSSTVIRRQSRPCCSQPNAPGRHPFHQRAYADPQKQCFLIWCSASFAFTQLHFSANLVLPYNQPVERKTNAPQFTGQLPYSGARHQEPSSTDARAQPHPIQESPQVNQRPLPYPVGSDIDELLEPSRRRLPAPSSVPNFLPTVQETAP